MAVKVTFALLAALVFLQGAFVTASFEDGSLEDPMEIAHGPITDTVRQSLERLTELVQIAIQEATSKLQDLNLISVLNPFKSQMTDIINKALGTIGEITQHATEIGIDVTTCTLNSANEINQLGFETARKMIDCGTGKIQDASTIIEDAITQVKKISDKVAEITQELMSCRVSVICITRVSAKIAASTLEFPIQISMQVAQTMELVMSLKGDLLNCGVATVGDSVRGIEDIVKAVGTCVAEKMNNH